MAGRVVINNEEREGPVGLEIHNFLDPKVYRFVSRRSQRNPESVNEIIAHETVTRSLEATVRVLKKRNLGAHFVIGASGIVTQHADVLDYLGHAGSIHNRASVGIEVVNPYYPKYLLKTSPWNFVLNAPWAHGKQYVVPTPEQAEATVLLVGWLTGTERNGVFIPRKWRGLVKDKMAMGRTKFGKWRKSGIHAHTYFHHADGAWLVLYCWLRLEAGMSPELAYIEAVDRALGVRAYADLSDLVEVS